MVRDLSQDITLPPSPASKTGPVQLRQAVAGLMPPQLAEALIRETWPSVRAGSKGGAALAASLTRTIILAPVAWLLILGPLFTLRLLPFVCRRYTLTNRRLMIRHGLKPKPAIGQNAPPVPGKEIALGDIDDVRIVPDSLDSFYHAADIEIISQGKTAMTLVAVPEPESFRQAIINAVRAWVPGKLKAAWQSAADIK
jgi:hypothetical protein